MNQNKQAVSEHNRPYRTLRLCYLYWGFASDVGHKEIHGNIFTVHMSIHPVLNVSGHFICVEIVEVLKRKNKLMSKHFWQCEKHNKPFWQSATLDGSDGSLWWICAVPYDRTQLQLRPLTLHWSTQIHISTCPFRGPISGAVQDIQPAYLETHAIPTHRHKEHNWDII